MTLADTPINWQEPPPMSTLHALLVFAGIPLLIIIAVSLLVMAPSLAGGPRYRPGQDWDAEPEQFGALPAARSGAAERTLEAEAPALREQATGATAERMGSSDDTSTGGASVSW